MSFPSSSLSQSPSQSLHHVLPSPVPSTPTTQIRPPMSHRRTATMPSAALLNNYTSRLITLHSLNNADIKFLASILCHIPTSEDWTATRQAIKDLPHHMRSSAFSHRRFSTFSQFMRREDKDGKVKAGELCRGHVGLNAGLVWNVWNCVRREFDKGIGHTFYPVIMHGGLSSSDEWKIRQLEPVLRMWHPEYNLTGSAPPGRAPIDAGEKWMYQENGCPACLLSRIGSEEGVVFALLVGCVARYPSRHVGKRDKVRSRRVRLIRCWLEAFEGGSRTVTAAWDLGEEIRRIRRNLREHERAWRGVGFYGHLISPQILGLVSGQGQDQTPARLRLWNPNLDPPNPPSPPNSTASSDIEIDISDPFNPNSPTLVNATVSSASSHSSEIGLDISEPYNPSNLDLDLDVPTSPYSQQPRGSSIYSRMTLGYATPSTTVSPPSSPTYTRSPGPSGSPILTEHSQQCQSYTNLSSDRQPFSSPSIISIPCSMHTLRLNSPDLQISSVPSSTPQLRNHGVSMRSLAVRVESARTEWGSECGDMGGWEERELVPKPLSTRSGSSRFRSMEGSLGSGSSVGLGIDVGDTRGGTATDTYRYDEKFGNSVDEGDKPGRVAEYDVSPPESPIEDSRNENRSGSAGSENLENVPIENLYDGSAYGGSKTPDREWYEKQLVKLGGYYILNEG